MTELKRKSNELARLIKAGFTPLESRRIAMAERRRMGFNFEKGESMTGEALRLYSQAANELVDWGYKKLKEYTNDCPDMDTNLIKRNIVKRDQFCEISMKIKGLD